MTRRYTNWVVFTLLCALAGVLLWLVYPLVNREEVVRRASVRLATGQGCTMIGTDGTTAFGVTAGHCVGKIGSKVDIVVNGATLTGKVLQKSSYQQLALIGVVSKEIEHFTLGELPALFKDEDELRNLWSRPDTRQKLLEGLEEKGYGREQLTELMQLVSAEKSDLFDVLAYVAFALAPMSREERVNATRNRIFEPYEDSQQEFLAFVLDHYVQQGVDELAEAKLPHLLELKYHAMADAVAALGDPGKIRELFIGFQQHLYTPQAVA